MLPRHEVLRLQLLAGAGGEAHAEVRQAFIPGAGDAHLLSTVLGRKLGNGVKVLSRQFRAETLRSRIESLAIVYAALDPNLIEPLLLPVGESAAAAGARF